MPQRGDPLSISARDWTDMQRVVDKYRNGGVSFRADALQSTYRSPAIVKVLNDTAGPLEHCAIVGLGEPVVLPSDNEIEFIRNIAFNIEPPLPGRWGVLQSPVAAGEITTAVVAGVVACRVNVISTFEPNLFADAIDATFAELQIRDSDGNAQILWRAGGTGSQWAVVRIGNTSSGAACSERLEKFVMLSNWISGLAVARFWFAGQSTGSGGMVGIVEDELLIFNDQLSYGKWGNSILDCNGRHFVIQARCAQATVVPSYPLGACILSTGDGGGCFQLSESDCEDIGGTWTLGDPCP